MRHECFFKDRKLFSQELTLIRQGHLDLTRPFEQGTLATQPRVQPGIDRPINKVLFFITDGLQKILSLVYIEMAGAAGTDPTAIVVQLNVVIERDLEQTLTGLYPCERN